MFHDPLIVTAAVAGFFAIGLLLLLAAPGQRRVSSSSAAFLGRITLPVQFRQGPTLPTDDVLTPQASAPRQMIALASADQNQERFQRPVDVAPFDLPVAG